MAGRPRDDKGPRRPNRTGFTLTDAEFAQLRALAAAHNMSVSELIRSLIREESEKLGVG